MTQLPKKCTEFLYDFFPFGLFIDDNFRIQSAGPSFIKLFNPVYHQDKIFDYVKVDQKIDSPNQLVKNLTKGFSEKYKNDFKMQAVKANEELYFVALETLLPNVSSLERLNLDITDFALNDPALDYLMLSHSEQKSKNKLLGKNSDLKTITDRLELALEASQIGVWEMDLQDLTIYGDNQTHKIYEVINSGKKGSYDSWLNQIHPEDRGRVDHCFNEILLKKINDLELQFRIILPSLEIKYVSIKAKVFFNNDGQPTQLLGVNWDTTEQILLEKELDDGRAQIIQSSKMSALGEMAGGIAHEVNNPLAIIQGYACRLTKQAEATTSVDSRSILETMEFINRSTSRISKIISGLHSFARDGSQDNFEHSYLHEIVYDTLTFCKARFANNDITLIINLDESILLLCRPVQISQVLLNFLNNAFDSVFEKNCLNCYVKLSSFLRKGKVVIAIEDNGLGISSQNSEKIMDPFFTTKEIGKGTGLGLSISKGIIESHNGDIQIVNHSNPTYFEITLPQAIHQAKKETA